MSTIADPWWRGSVIYQIWPRSFSDSDGDGIGDLEGVRRRLDYLNDGQGGGLGVDAIWLSPFFTSPLVDYGYDVADYVDVDPTFGTLETFDQLVSDAHDRSMKVVLDFVPNHSSDQHSWFLESKRDKLDPRRDWYVWRDPSPSGGPPNNWVSAFGSFGSAWTFDPATSQYYLHSYTPNQPDLNWDNPEVREAMKSVTRFWFDRGVDGFRIDVVHRLAKDPAFGDNSPDHLQPEPVSRGRHDADWSTIDERLAELRGVADEYGNSLLVGEVYILDQARLVDYLGRSRLHLGHNFVFLNQGWSAHGMAGTIEKFESLAGPDVEGSWCLNNHDHSRVVTRFGDHGPDKARAAALLLLGLRGTAFIYQGEELGLPDTDLPADEVLDVDGRDPCRTPMPWASPASGGPGAGFTTGTPWLPVGETADRLNVADELRDPSSMLSLYQHLIRARNANPALRYGEFKSFGCNEEVFVFRRYLDESLVDILVNFGDGPRSIADLVVDCAPENYELLASSRSNPTPDQIAGYEARWIKQVSPQKNS